MTHTCVCQRSTVSIPVTILGGFLGAVCGHRWFDLPISALLLHVACPLLTFCTGIHLDAYVSRDTGYHFSSFLTLPNPHNIGAKVKEKGWCERALLHWNLSYMLVKDDAEVEEHDEFGDVDFTACPQGE